MAEEVKIQFSPPDIGNAEKNAVLEALDSGWITTGPLTKEFECAISTWAGTKKTACLSSATAALECALRLLDIREGDEVITSAYTYTASASVIYHVGATPILVDTAQGSYEMDYDQLGERITSKTKAIIPVDIAGRMCDYDTLFAVLTEHAKHYSPRQGSLQQCFDRPIVLADAAHSFGATYRGKPAGSVADLTAFSFHAVKNLTTGEGGALTWRTDVGFDDDKVYQRLMELSLHGQDRDALSKERQRGWEYDILEPAWKCNMTDITAALGLAQLRRYPVLLEKRYHLVALYREELEKAGMLSSKTHVASSGSFDGMHVADRIELLDHFPSSDTASSCHLLLTRLNGKQQSFRNALIEKMDNRGIKCNVHYKPLPLLTAYRDRGFDIADFPHAYAQFENELSLPLHTKLSDEDVRFVVENLVEAYEMCERAGA